MTNSYKSIKTIRNIIACFTQTPCPSTKIKDGRGGRIGLGIPTLEKQFAHWSIFKKLESMSTALTSKRTPLGGNCVDATDCPPTYPINQIGNIEIKDGLAGPTFLVQTEKRAEVFIGS